MCLFVQGIFFNGMLCFQDALSWGFFPLCSFSFCEVEHFFFRKVTSLEFLSPLQMFKKKIHFLHSCPCNFLYFQVTKRITWRSLPVNSISIHHVTCWHSFIGSHVGVTIPNLYSSIILHTVNIIAITDFTINVFRFFFFNISLFVNN